MNNFNSVVKNILLQEALSKKDIKKIESFGGPSRDSNKLHDSVFGKGVERAEIPFTPPSGTHSSNYKEVYPTRNQSAHHTEVFNHLHENGYRVSDYEKGYCHKADDLEGKRKFSIGSILQQTGGDEKVTGVSSKETYRYHTVDGNRVKMTDGKGNPVVDKPSKKLTVSQCFSGDPLRQGANTPMKLIVSRNKLDVGGMSSGKNWRSCMTLEDGCNRHYVPKDIEHGTLSAYVVRASGKGDDIDDNAIGRRNLKPFVSDGHTIVRPETSNYGIFPKSAAEALHEWSKEKYPAKQGELYGKHSALYNDDGKSIHIEGKLKSNDVSKLHDHIHDTVDRVMDEYEGRETKFGEDEYNAMDHIHNVAHQAMSSIEGHGVRSLVAVHAVVARDKEVDGDDDYHMEHGNPYYRDTWGHNPTSPRSYLSASAIGHHIPTVMSNEQLHAGINHIRSEIGESSDSGDTDKYSNSKRMYGDMVDEMSKRSRNGDIEAHGMMQEHIGHFFDNDSEHHYFHHDVYHNHITDNTAHEIMHPEKPGSINKLLTGDHEFENHPLEQYWNGEVRNGELHDSFAHHAGKHADQNVVDTVMKHIDSATKSGDRFFHEFTKGLNENPNGKELQHGLTSGMYLHGGEANKGEIVDTTRVMDKNDNISFQPIHANVGPQHNPQNIFHHIAANTKFKSVHDALSNRYDTKGEIADELHGNENKKRGLLEHKSWLVSTFKKLDTK